MTIETALALALASFVFMASPGPGTFALLGHALAHGFGRTFGFILGMVAGDLVYLALAIGGMAIVARAFEAVFLGIRIAAAVYLIWLGLRAWRAVPLVFAEGSAALERAERAHHARGFISGLLVTLSNPKVIMFYIGFLPAFIGLDTLSAGNAALLSGIVIGVLFSLMTAYAATAGRARAMLRGERAQRLLNRGSGTVMIGAAIAIAVRA